MVPENTDVKTTASPDEILAGNVDEDLKKKHDQIKTRVSDVPECITILKTGGLIEPRKSAEAPGEIGDEHGVLPLIDAMKDPSTNVQYLVIKSPGIIGDRRTVDPHISALKSDEKWIRLDSAQSPGHIGDKNAVEFLIPLLTDSRHNVRAHAARALGKTGDARAIELPKTLLRDPKEDVGAEGRLHRHRRGVKNNS